MGAHLRVNHAGEAGAIQIYRAQRWICRWRAPELLPLLTLFQADEERHLAAFEVHRRRLGEPVCGTLRLCQVGGWALGAFSALWGRQGVAACTEGVEAIVLAHLREQRTLIIEQGDLALLACLESIIEDEQVHHDADVTAGARQESYRWLRQLATQATRGVIALGLRAR